MSKYLISKFNKKVNIVKNEISEFNEKLNCQKIGDLRSYIIAFRRQNRTLHTYVSLPKDNWIKEVKEGINSENGIVETSNTTFSWKSKQFA